MTRDWLVLAFTAGACMTWPSLSDGQTASSSSNGIGNDTRQCVYDDATSTFHFSPDRKMTLLFGLHGVPSFIDTYIRGGDPQDAKRVRELLDSHKEFLALHASDF